MQAIFDFFAGIAEGLSAIVSFVVDLLSDVVYVVELTAEFVLKIPEYLSWLPAPVLAVVVSIFVVVVIYKILGREG